MLIRPIAIGVSIISVIYLLFGIGSPSHKLRFSFVVFLLAGSLVAVLPWEGWVYFRSGEVIMLSMSGIPAVRDGLTFPVDDEYGRGETIPLDVRLLTKDILDNSGKLDTYPAVASYLIDQMKQQPLTMLKLIGIKLARSWYGTESGKLENWILPIQLVYLLFVLYGAWIGWKHGGEYRKYVLFVAMLVGYFWFMTFVALSILRYMVPAMSLCLTLIPLGLLSFPATEKTFIKTISK
jgi:hypothetical protein